MSSQKNGPAMSMSLTTAVKAWKEKNPDKSIDEETHVKFICTSPPIDKIDNAIGQFTNCVQLSLSTNCIDKIPLLPGASLPNLKILSLGRNVIKKITGLDEVGATLKELWISYNQISTLEGLNACVELDTLFIANNKIKDINELKRLSVNPNLVNINLTGNPLYDGAIARAENRSAVIRTLPQIKTLDGELYTGAEVLVAGA
jgi:dynein light chain 1, axonemal